MQQGWYTCAIIRYAWFKLCTFEKVTFYTAKRITFLSPSLNVIMCLYTIYVLHNTTSCFKLLLTNRHKIHMLHTIQQILSQTTLCTQEIRDGIQYSLSTHAVLLAYSSSTTTNTHLPPCCQDIHHPRINRRKRHLYHHLPHYPPFSLHTPHTIYNLNAAVLCAVLCALLDRYIYCTNTYPQ